MKEIRVVRRSPKKFLTSEEMDDRRFRGLCEFCGEKFTPGHYLKHKKFQLYVMEIEEIRDAGEDLETSEASFEADVVESVVVQTEAIDSADEVKDVNDEDKTSPDLRVACDGDEDPSEMATDLQVSVMELEEEGGEDKSSDLQVVCVDHMATDLYIPLHISDLVISMPKSTEIGSGSGVAVVKNIRVFNAIKRVEMDFPMKVVEADIMALEPPTKPPDKFCWIGVKLSPFKVIVGAGNKPMSSIVFIEHLLVLGNVNQLVGKGIFSRLLPDFDHIKFKRDLRLLNFRRFNVVWEKEKNCDALQGFWVLHSLGGGTGLGMMFSVIREEYQADDTAAYYSRKSSNWILEDSCLDYKLKAEVLSALFSINFSHAIVLSDADIVEDSSFPDAMITVKMESDESMEPEYHEKVKGAEIGGLTKIGIDCVRISDIGCTDMEFKCGLSEFRPPAKPPNGGYFADGLSCVLIGAKNLGIHKNQGYPDVCAISPRRADLPAERGALTVFTAAHRQKTIFFFLLETEYGDVFKVTPKILSSRFSTKRSCWPARGTSPVAAYADSPTADKFSSLPIVYLKEKIVEKIMENRVTLIVGETGCGKSSQVLQYLLEKQVEPILYTQPRRVAVVVVARMVAKASNCEVGTEVGYHIGHSKVMSKGSKIVFKTAGILFDEMSDRGMNALKYKVIILDEVHERSVESDLVLVCVKHLMLKNNDLRVVLMSNTADTSRYKDYFRDLGRGERVEVLAIPSSNERSFFQKKVLYLEQIAELLGKTTNSSDSLSVAYCSGPTPDTAEPSLKPELHSAIHNLVMHIHNNEPDVEKSILIFLPTYNSLEQQWSLMKPYSSIFKVHILHSSIDTEQALSAMKIWKIHRKVILATNIAESSVTIPKLAYVIDSCRSLQVYWDNNRKAEASHLVWVSKSQAEQRRGRTGRTCDGLVYRLVTGSFFNKLQDHESPAILNLSLRQQVLSICCAESRVINDPKVLLQKTLDPPDPEVVEDALSLLVYINALRKSPRGRYGPTFYGKLLSSFSLSFDASVLIVKFGDIGMLREGIILGILMDIQPLPILRPFGEDNLSATYSESYYKGDVRNGSLLPGKKEMNIMANLSAYQFWQRVFKDKQRLEHLKQLLRNNTPDGNNLLYSQIEEEWCSVHKLVKSSLHQISEIYDDVLCSLHLQRPKFLVASNGRPLCYASFEYQHSCLLQQLDGDSGDPHVDDGLSTETIKCVAEPYVGPENFRSQDVAINLARVVKEIRILFNEDASGSQSYPSMDGYHSNGDEDIQCTYFAMGMCNKGDRCLFSHSPHARVPACKFFFSIQGCRNGESCHLSHASDPSLASTGKSSLCKPEERRVDSAQMLRFFPKSTSDCILLLDESNLHFSSYVSHHGDTIKILTPRTLPKANHSSRLFESVKVLWNSYNTGQLTVPDWMHDSISWDRVRSVLWFPTFDRCGDSKEEQKNLVKKFFQDMALRILRGSLFNIWVIITMNNVRFSQLQVEKWARDSFFFIGESFPFDEFTFGELQDKISFQKAMVTPQPVSYVFYMHPTKDVRSFADSLKISESLGNLSIS